MRLILQSAILLGCIVYVVLGLDWREVLLAVQAYDIVRVGVAPILAVVALIPFAFRLSSVLDDQMQFTTAWKAIALGSAFNNIFPAKIGELAKVNYLVNQEDITAGRGAELVFWERFSDLNALLLIGIAATLVMGMNISLAPMIIVVVAWGLLGFAKNGGSLVDGIIQRIPFKWIRETATEFIRALNLRTNMIFYVKLTAYTFTIWAFMAAVTFYYLNGIAGFQLGIGPVLAVFIVSTLGAAVPLAPGGLGTYEASIVMSLGWFNVPHDQALAIAILMRVTQYITVTACGLLVFSFTDISFGQLSSE